MTVVYSLYEYEGLEHWHICEGVLIQQEPLQCNTASAVKTVCGKITTTEQKKTASAFRCKTVKQALSACILSTKPICASCEQHVFKKYQEAKGIL